MFYRPQPPEPVALRVLGDLIDIVVVVLGASMILLMSINVFARATNAIDLAANVELGEFCLVWATFLGGAGAARRMAHMRVSELVDALPKRAARALDRLTRLLSIALLAIILWKGISIVGSTWGDLSSVLYWPAGLTYLALPVGAGLCIVFIGYQIVRPPAPGQRADGA